MRNHALTPTSDLIATLPPSPELPPQAIELVRTEADALQAWQWLQAHSVWGFDTESRPVFLKDQTSDGPHVLQLATPERACVIQLHDPACSQRVGQWLADASRLKVGFGLRDDLRRIRARLGVETASVLELNTVFRQLGHRHEVGVKAAVAVLFGERLTKSKKVATSDWSAAHLSPAQLRYAANDAWAARRVHDGLVAQHPQVLQRVLNPTRRPTWRDCAA